MVDEIFDCPQCGEECSELVEGYCSDCTHENYNEIQAFEAQRKWWSGLSDEERKRQIDQQCI